MDRPISRKTSWTSWQLVQRNTRWQLVVLLLAALAILFLPTFVSAAPPTERTYRIEARSFEYTPPTIQVNQGDRLTLELASTDVVHGLYIDGYDLNVVADPGQTAKFTFIADQSGSFRFRCSVTCGALHPFMIGKLEVGTNWLWWQAIGFAVLAVIIVSRLPKSSRLRKSELKSAA
ncbi:MAG: cupredoxin domain-containing protein [Chloroflexi bacterium]|nr:cupredoxin domain-containing protein [Chloroflexota bacterium]